MKTKHFVFFVAIAIVAAFAVAATSLAGEKAAPEQKFCPVKKGEIKKDVFVDHEGQRVYFCCKGCIAKFKEDPEKYMKKLEAQLKAGGSDDDEKGCDHGEKK